MDTVVVGLQHEATLGPDHAHLVAHGQPPQQRREAEDGHETHVELVALVGRVPRSRGHRVGPLVEHARRHRRRWSGTARARRPAASPSARTQKRPRSGRSSSRRTSVALYFSSSGAMTRVSLSGSVMTASVRGRTRGARGLPVHPRRARTAARSSASSGRSRQPPSCTDAWKVTEGPDGRSGGARRAVRCLASTTPTLRRPHARQPTSSRFPCSCLLHLTRPHVAAKRYIYAWGAGAAEGDGTMKDLLGGKGAGLAEMTLAGLPTPPGFTITTEACNDYFAAGKQLPDGPLGGRPRGHARGRAALRQGLRRPRQPAPRVGPLGRQVLDAGHDGHRPQPRPQRGDAAGAHRAHRQRALRLGRLSPLHRDVRTHRHGRGRRRASTSRSRPASTPTARTPRTPT